MESYRSYFDIIATKQQKKEVALIPMLQKQTLAARERTNKRIATAVKQRKFQVQEIIYKGSKTEVIELTDFLPIEDAIQFIKEL